MQSRLGIQNAPGGSESTPYRSSLCFFQPRLVLCPIRTLAGIPLVVSLRVVLFLGAHKPFCERRGSPLDCPLMCILALFCTLLYSTVLHCALLLSTVHYCSLLYVTVPVYCKLLQSTVQYCTLLNKTAHYCTQIDLPHGGKVVLHRFGFVVIFLI